MSNSLDSVHETSRAERGVRRLLMSTLLLGMCGVTADLLLLDHVEDPKQVIPVALLGLAMLALVLHVIIQGPGSVRMLQGTMWLFMACGALGAYLHFEGNAAFQRDIDADISQGELVWKALRAKAPPALAPMAFVQLGLVGLAWSYRHPLLRGTKHGS